MKKVGDLLSSRVHSGYLKPLGFTKKRHNFYRTSERFMEHYEIQGSSWNSRDTPWTFYLNCGLRFADLENDSRPDNVWMRAERLVPDAPPQYDVTAENMFTLSADLAEVIRRCSEYFQNRHAALRQFYIANGRFVIGDPEQVP